MKVIDLAMNAALGMQESPEGADHLLELPDSSLSLNHVGTAHASVQFALAEACSGQWLSCELKGIQERVLPLLRHATVKYRKPARGKLIAFADVVEGEEVNLIESLFQKNRLLVSLKATIKDEHQQTTMTGQFDWFLQLQQNDF